MDKCKPYGLLNLTTMYLAPLGKNIDLLSKIKPCVILFQIGYLKPDNKVFIRNFIDLTDKQIFFVEQFYLLVELEKKPISYGVDTTPFK